MAIIDSVIRLIPGVLGDETSSQSDSFSGGSAAGDGWLEGAQYTRPREFRGHEVPEVLLGGNHQEIERWRSEQSYLTTRRRRADLLNQSKSNQTKTNQIEPRKERS
jgi:tRNA (guanine37-N1)-methyltransferase